MQNYTYMMVLKMILKILKMDGFKERWQEHRKNHYNITHTGNFKRFLKRTPLCQKN